MAIQNGMPQGFVKHVVRRASLVARATTTPTLAATPAAKTSNSIARAQTSSLEPPVVAIILGGFVGVFLLFVLIGITCKFANRPRADDRPQMYAKGMYQPSAAGYGSSAVSYSGGYRANESMHDVSNANTGLLDSAQPMGRGGRYEEADTSLGSFSGGSNGQAGTGVNGGFGMVASNSASFSADESHRFISSRGGHARGASSGIELPGPAASGTFRRNVSGAHPPIHASADDSYDSPHLASGLASASVLPDGSGFTPGQIFDHSAVNGGAPKGGAEIRAGGPPAGFLPRRSSVAQANPQQRPYLRGPPPASSRNHRSRYAQGGLAASTDTTATRRSRIDSVGPGTYRKSMFLPEDGQDGQPGDDSGGGSQMRRTTSNNNGGGPRPLRRVDSIGKGDPRRSSRYHPNNRNSKIASMMVQEPNGSAPASGPGGYHAGLPPTSGGGLLGAGGAGVWDGGRRSPYGGSSNGSSSPLGPLGPNDAGLNMQLQQQQPQYTAGGGVRMMPYGAGLGAPMPRPGIATTSISSPSSFAQAAPLGAGLGRGMEASSHATSRQIL